MCSMSVGDLYMVKDKHRNVQGVEFLNVYFYQGTGDGISSHLGDAFLSNVVDAVKDMQAIDINHYEVEVASCLTQRISRYRPLTSTVLGLLRQAPPFLR